MAEVQLKEVDKVYEGDVHAVQDLSIDVADGEFLVLVGPSGCGKTTALRMIAGLESITDGTITIGDRVVNQLSPKDRDIAMVFQNYALYPHLSVADNIAFGLRLRKTPKNLVEERIAWAAKLLDLTPYLARKPKELSGGQRQRVAMGRAIVREPQVFLMDEPLSNLDAKLRIQMRSEIAKLQHELDTTTIYVTHDQIEAMTMGDRVAVMSMGVLQQVDRPQQLYDAPRSVFVASFIGTPPMNLFRGTILTDDGTVAVMLGSTRIAVEQACVARYRGIRELNGRNAVIGVRAEDLYPASTRAGSPHDRSTRRARRGARLRRHGALPHRRGRVPLDRGARCWTCGRRQRRRTSAGRSVALSPRNLTSSRTSRHASSCGWPTPCPLPSTPARSISSTRRRVSRSLRAGLVAVVVGATLAVGASGAVSSQGAAPKPTGAALDALAKPPTYSAFASQRIYFVMPDRYANGDPSNDRGGLTGPRSVTGYDPADPGWYHGGDLKGLTGSCTDTRTGLARIKGLGFTALWVTPVVVQQYVQADSAAYHGYWGLDFTRVDPHLGSNADFAAFVECAHSLRMKVYLDVVVNHTADVIIPAGGLDLPWRGRGAVPRLQGQAVLGAALRRHQPFSLPLEPLPTAPAARPPAEPRASRSPPG